MKIRAKIRSRSIQFFVGLVAMLLTVASSLTAQETGSIQIDRSSTVYPITQKIIEDYQANKKQPAAIEVGFSGTGGGFEQFCQRETDINNASRPLFIYVNAASAQKNQDLRQFIDFYLAQAPELAEEVGYVTLPEEAYQINKVTFYRGEVGTVFEGQSQFNLTIPELLRKQAQS